MFAFLFFFSCFIIQKNKKEMKTYIFIALGDNKQNISFINITVNFYSFFLFDHKRTTRRTETISLPQRTRKTMKKFHFFFRRQMEPRWALLLEFGTKKLKKFIASQQKASDKSEDLQGLLNVTPLETFKKKLFIYI